MVSWVPFAKCTAARLPLCITFSETLTALPNPLYAAERKFDPFRIDRDISTRTRGFTTKDAGISLDWTDTYQLHELILQLGHFYLLEPMTFKLVNTQGLG